MHACRSTLEDPTSAFERALIADAKRHDVDGIICGHIHHAAIHETYGIRYVNCGDWVESCTAIAEHADGRLEIIDWGQGAPVIQLPARVAESQAA